MLPKKIYLVVCDLYEYQWNAGFFYDKTKAEQYAIMLREKEDHVSVEACDIVEVEIDESIKPVKYRITNFKGLEASGGFCDTRDDMGAVHIESYMDSVFVYIEASKYTPENAMRHYLKYLSEKQEETL